MLQLYMGAHYTWTFTVIDYLIVGIYTGGYKSESEITGLVEFIIYILYPYCHAKRDFFNMYEDPRKHLLNKHGLNIFKRKHKIEIL